MTEPPQGPRPPVPRTQAGPMDGARPARAPGGPAELRPTPQERGPGRQAEDLTAPQERGPGRPAERRAVAQERVPGWAVWTLRLVVLVVAVLVLLQPVFAGLFVTGDVGMLRMHSTMAGFITMLAFFQFVAALLVWRPGRGAAWPMWASLGFFVAAEAQSGFGYARLVGAHIPFGVALFGLTVAMLIGTWSPRLRVRRSAPRHPEAQPGAPRREDQA